MMSSAQRNLSPLDEAAGLADAGEPFALKEQVAQRLAAHRARRGQSTPSAAEPRAARSNANGRAAQIAAAVAERYSQQQSYRAFLAAEAERAIREAEAAAQVAAISAQAVADAQYELLERLDAELDAQLDSSSDSSDFQLTAPAPLALVPKLQHDDSAPRHRAHAPRAVEEPLLPLVPAAENLTPPALTVRIAEEFLRPLAATPGMTGREAVHSADLRAHIYGPIAASPMNADERLALDEEIAFRQAPVFEAMTPPVDIPANLLEFPRQLVAARKARPRLAEGPLREDVGVAHDANSAQLRIFEVEAEQISPAPPVASVEPEWTSILLAAHPASAPVESAEPQFIPTPAPQAAPFNLRLMAAMVDGTIVGCALLMFLVAAFSTVQKLAPTAVITLPVLAIASVVTFVVLLLAYQALFFTFAEATPGMLYARIGLCTLSDDNPTRSAMRRRIFAVLLAAFPLGIGFLWAFLDEEGLGWHDRVSRMYQRAY